MGYAAGYKKNVDLEMLDPTGVVVEKFWTETAWTKQYRGLAVDQYLPRLVNILQS
jgi:hypothetical protein